MTDTSENNDIIADTRAWVNHAVIGLNLCPFARAVETKRQIRYVVTEAETPDALLGSLCDEIRLLLAADPAEIETTLLIHPHVLTDFLSYNDFLSVADAAVAELAGEGVLQVASFHPHYQFAGTEPDDVSNATNQSPYPTLHLLREDSITRAVDVHADTDAIFETNIQTMESLGAAGWSELRRRWLRGSAVNRGNSG